MFGVMRIINLAHGDLAVLGAFLVFVLSEHGLSPVGRRSLIVLPAMALVRLGAAADDARAQPARRACSRPLLTTFGLAIVIQNLLFEKFGADERSLFPYIGTLGFDSWTITSQIIVAKLYVLIFVVAIVLLGGLQLFLSPHAARPRAPRHGRGSRHRGAGRGQLPAVYALAAAIAVATAALAGAFLGMRSSFNPYSGSQQLIFAFEAVVIGGHRLALGNARRRDRARRLPERRRAAEPAVVPARRATSSSSPSSPSAVLGGIRGRGGVPRRPGAARVSDGAAISVQRWSRVSVVSTGASGRRRCGAGVRPARPVRERHRQADDALRLRDPRRHVERARGLRGPRFGRPAGVLRARRVRGDPALATRRRRLSRARARSAPRRRGVGSASRLHAAPARRRVRDRDVGRRRGLLRARDPGQVRRRADRHLADRAQHVQRRRPAQRQLLDGARRCRRAPGHSVRCCCAAARARRCRRSATTRRRPPRWACASCEGRA